VPNPLTLNIGAAYCDRSNARGSNVRPACGSVRRPWSGCGARPSIGTPHETRLAPRRQLPALGLAW
jgi:hypothetical protein